MVGNPLLMPLRKALSAFWWIDHYRAITREVLKAVLGFRPHIVHAHLGGLTTGLVLRRTQGIHLVHSVPATLLQAAAGDGNIELFGAYRRHHQRIDRFLTGYPSELFSLGVPPSKVLPIFGLVDLDATEPVRSKRARHRREARLALGLPDSAVIALSVGRLNPSKGHLYAIEALARLVSDYPDLYLVILGEGAQRAELEGKVAELDLTGRVHLPGFKPEPLPFYAAADLYLRTPVFEADNLSSYQAMAMGLPVIGFDTGAETELINKAGHGLLVPNRDSAGLADAIVQVLSAGDRGRAMGALGIDFCRAHLDMREGINKILATYLELAAADWGAPRSVHVSGRVLCK